MSRIEGPHRVLDEIITDGQYLFQEVYSTFDREVIDSFSDVTFSLIEKSRSLSGILVSVEGPEALVETSDGVVLVDNNENTHYGLYRGLGYIETALILGGIRTDRTVERLAHLIKVSEYEIDEGLDSVHVDKVFAFPVETSKLLIRDPKYGIDYEILGKLEVGDPLLDIIESINIIAIDEDLNLTERLQLIGETLSIKGAILGNEALLNLAGYLNGLGLLVGETDFVPEYFYYLEENDSERPVLHDNEDQGYLLELDDVFFTVGAEVDMAELISGGESSFFETIVISGIDEFGVRMAIPLNQTILVELFP